MTLLIRSLAAVAAAGVGGSALACVCAEQTYEERYTAAGSVFVGTVVDESNLIRQMIDGGTTTLQVEGVFKGLDTRTVEVVDSMGCAVGMKMGERYLVFGGNRLPLAVSRCDGTGPIASLADAKERLGGKAWYAPTRDAPMGAGLLVTAGSVAVVLFFVVFLAARRRAR